MDLPHARLTPQQRKILADWEKKAQEVGEGAGWEGVRGVRGVGLVGGGSAGLVFRGGEEGCVCG